MSRPDLRVVGGGPVRSSGASAASNADAEVAILACVIDDPRTALPAAMAMGLSAEHFYSDPNGRAWLALVQMSQIPDAVIHVVTVAQWLKDYSVSVALQASCRAWICGVRFLPSGHALSSAQAAT